MSSIDSLSPFSPYFLGGDAILPVGAPGEPEMDEAGFPVAATQQAMQLSLQEDEQRIQTQQKGKPLEKVQIEYLVNSVLSATAKEAAPLAWGRMVVLDIHYLFDNIPNQLTWFRVAVFGLVYFGGQNIFMAVFLGWFSSPEGRDRWLSPSIKDYINEINFHEPAVKKWTDFKHWLSEPGADFYMVKTSLKASFIALNVIFKAVYDVTTAYPILTYMNSEQPAVMLAGVMLFFLMISRGDYVKDIHEVQKQAYNLSVEHMIYPINKELPDELTDDEVLKNYICPISLGVMVYPAKVSCGHHMEMREVIRLRGTSSQCPCCRKNITNITFDKEAHKKITERLEQLEVSPV